MIEIELSSEVDYFINFISRNISYFENSAFKVESDKIAIQKKISEYLIKEQEKSKEPLLANKDLLIKDYLLQAILFDKNLFPDNIPSGNKRNFLKAWLKEKYTYAFGASLDELEKVVEFIWEGYTRDIKENNNNISRNNCRNFFIALNYLYQPDKFNDSEKKRLNILLAFFDHDLVLAPKILLSESPPPYCKNINDFIEAKKSLVFTEVFASYNQELNLITLYKTGILWFCEENNCNFEEVKTVVLLYALLNYFLEIKQFDPLLREKVSQSLLNHFLDEEISDIPKLMNIKGSEFIDEFPSEEIDRLHDLLKNGVERQIFANSNFFCEERNKDLFYTILRYLDSTFTFSAKILSDDLNKVGRPNLPEDLKARLTDEYSILFDKYYELQTTKIKALKVNKELKNVLLLNESKKFASKKVFNHFIEENNLKYLKFFFFTYFLQEKSAAGISLLLRALKKSHISNTLRKRLYERETYQKDINSLDNNVSENNDNKLLDIIENKNELGSNDTLILKDISFKIIQNLYDLLAEKVDDINNLRKICKIFLTDIIGMKKINLAESLVVQPSVITEIEQRLAVDLIYLFDIKPPQYLQEIRNADFSDVNLEKFEQSIENFIKEKLDLRYGLSKLKLFFVENLKKYDIDPKQSSKTHHENIIKALIAFEIKKYYRRFSEKYSLNEKQLDLFQEELINEIINSQRQKIKNLKINQEIFEKIKDFAKKEKIEKLQQIDRSEVKDLFRFVQRFGADTGRKINFSADIYDYKKFLKYLRDIIGQKFTDFKDIFFSQILKKDSLSEFSSIDPNDWNVIFFSFFLNFLINSFQLAVENESHRGRQNFIVLKEKEQLEKFLNDEKIISRELMKVDFINKNEGIYVQDIKS